MFCCSPMLESLVEAADEQFAFVSAMSGSPGEEEPPPAGGSSAVEARMERMEKMVFGLQKNMENFLALRKGDSSKFVRKKQVSAEGSWNPGGRREVEPSWSGPDSRSGSFSCSSGEKSRSGRSRVAEIGLHGVQKPQARRRSGHFQKTHYGSGFGGGRRSGVGRGSRGGGRAGGRSTKFHGEIISMQKAVMKLTKIVDSFAAQKKPRGLDALLDGADAEAQDPSSSSSGKSKAALYKKLRRSLLEDPKYVFQTIENLMDEDFQLLRMAPGVPALSLISTRAWMEYRSRLLHYPTTLRYVWAIAGIHDCLRQGRSDEARARCALMMAAADQTSLDGGNWLLSQEILLEEPPPFASFPRQEAARDLGSSSFEAPGREVAGCSYVESSQQRFLPRVQEETQPGQRRQRRSPQARRSRSSTAKERSQRWKGPDEVREQKEGGRGGALGAAKLGKSYDGGASGYEAEHEEALPGSRATTVHGYSLWNSLFDFLGRGRSRLSLTWLAVRAGHALKKASTGRVWPLPLPYPELHRRGGRRGRQESARKLGCNFVVLVLNFLKFPERHWRNVTPPLGTALNKRQWDVVGRISTAIETWNDQDASHTSFDGSSGC